MGDHGRIYRQVKRGKNVDDFKFQSQNKTELEHVLSCNSYQDEMLFKFSVTHNPHKCLRKRLSTTPLEPRFPTKPRKGALDRQ